MSIKKEIAIEDIFDDFSGVSEIILLQLKRLKDIIISGDIIMSKEIFAGFEKNEKTIDKYEIKISEKVINTIVLYNPFASDLRKIIAIYNMTLSIESIGDLVINIIKSARTIENAKLFEKSKDSIYKMLKFSTNLVQNALLSFANSDLAAALDTIKMDKFNDELNQLILEKAVKKGKSTSDIEKVLLSFVSLRSIVSNIERIANFAVNIAEATVYALEGTDIRHKKVKYN
jgi:phosphate transport system protein